MPLATYSTHAVRSRPRPLSGGLRISGPVLVVVSAQTHQAGRSIAAALEAGGRDETRGAAVAIEEGMNRRELVMGDRGGDGVLIASGALEPGNELGHPRRHHVRRRGRGHDLAGDLVDHRVLNPAVRAGRRRSSAHTLHQPPVRFADDRLCERGPLGKVVLEERRGLDDVRHLPAAVRIDIFGRIPCQNPSCLLKGDACALDDGGVIRILGQGGSLELAIQRGDRARASRKP